ncbi:MAG: Gfo/Idh/MocA family protein [Spirochaetaceae bacterium]
MKRNAVVVGLGIGMAHCAGYLDHPEVRLYGVSDLIPERRDTVGGTFAAGSFADLRPLFDPAMLGRRWEDLGVRVYADLDEVLSDPEVDIVSLCTPDHFHVSHTEAVLEADKHLLLEKPVALRPAEAVRLLPAVRAARERGIMVAVGYEFRRNPAVLRLRELVRGGTLGEIAAFSLYHYRTPFRRDKWEHWIEREELSGGLIVEETSHWLDLARYIPGKEIGRVHTETTDRIHAEFDFEDIAYISGRYTDGAVFQISHALTGFDFSIQMQLHGTSGSAWCGLKDARYSALDAGASSYLGVLAWGPQNGRPADAQVETFEESVTEPFNIRDFTRHVASCVVGGAAPPVSYEDGMRCLEAAVAARQAARTGVPAELEETSY